jgi:hypothetical protein
MVFIVSSFDGVPRHPHLQATVPKHPPKRETFPFWVKHFPTKGSIKKCFTWDFPLLRGWGACPHLKLFQIAVSYLLKETKRNCVK